MKKIILLLVLCVCFYGIQAQNEKYIEVRGSAESEITPNIITISVRLQEYDENKEKVLLDKIDREFNEVITKSNIRKENVLLSGVTASAVQRKKERDFYAQKTYEITFSNSGELLSFLNKLGNVKIHSLHIVKTSHTEMEKYRLEIKTEALKAAEKKAQVLLAAIGSKKGKPLLIEELPVDETDWRPYNATANIRFRLDSSGGNTDTEQDIPFKKIVLKFEVKARFEIE